MFCSKCGKKVSDESSFCWNCGEKIVTEPVDESKEEPEEESIGKLIEDILAMTKTIENPVEIGSTITFGTYPQDPKGEKSPIEWKVLDKQGNKALVISKYALDSRAYNSSYTDVTWETCSLRQWLNGTFLQNTFNGTEQSKIQTTLVPADKNLNHDTDSGNATNDKVFLLSINEATKYFSSDEARKCVPTEYAKKNGAWTSDTDKVGGKETCYWWLRSPGSFQKTAAFVGYDGSFIYDGFGVFLDNDSIRPAMWIEL